MPPVYLQPSSWSAKSFKYFLLTTISLQRRDRDIPFLNLITGGRLQVASRSPATIHSRAAGCPFSLPAHGLLSGFPTSLPLSHINPQVFKLRLQGVLKSSSYCHQIVRKFSSSALWSSRFQIIHFSPNLLSHHHTFNLLPFSFVFWRLTQHPNIGYYVYS
ncbi:hypothetical protein B0H14DRAFT_2994486 [Mycena olivaceomarginata]|nr:hypothetical protein B0H14DRAFT_2994486 [Mycena olivaceomarginata]